LTLITTLMTGLTFMNLGAAAQQAAKTTESGLTCNINGIPPHNRARYGRLVEALRRAIVTLRIIWHKILRAIWPSRFWKL